MPARGGRGGGGGTKMPFMVDPEIEAAAERAAADDSGDDAILKELFSRDVEILAPRRPTAEERALVRCMRENDTRRRAGPFWTGDRGDYASRGGDPDMPGGFNPFDNADTWSNRKRKRGTSFPDSTKLKKALYSRFQPPEIRKAIWPEIYGESKHAKAAKAKRPKLGTPRKSVKNKLANFDSDNEGDANEDDEEAPEKAQDGEEHLIETPVDDAYEEDDDDADNDYNAEKFFENGEAELEDYGGEEYGDDGY